MPTRINLLERWLEGQSPEEAAAFRAYCRETQSLQAAIAYLVQKGGDAAGIPQSEVKTWLENLKGSEAKLFDKQNIEYLGVDLSGVLDKMVVQLSDQAEILTQRIEGTLNSNHPLRDEMTYNGALSARSTVLRELRQTIEQLEKRRAKTDRHSLAWGVAARLRALFMNQPPVRDSENESWCNEHWNTVLLRFEQEIERLV